MTDPTTILAGVGCAVAFLFLVACFAVAFIVVRNKSKPRQVLAQAVQIEQKRSISRDMHDLGFEHADVIIGQKLGEDFATRLTSALAPAPT